ncbi:hypothetical protein [Mycobacterium sp. SMC-4]|uniref:hypothetical protein n=1 Tax=Mycobacterium sp. SMC-4 TaxID=2857059 RepID=UPI0021B30CBA|nr:hypothetical protein [Mycobacterium sp. SMC-4]UXA18669.1 hypothetical protein KXD98_02870 [Mycobacterium sp. SMC-4]
MTRRAVVELLVAVVVAAGAVLSWLAASSAVVVAPILEGEPATVSQVYSAPLLTLSLLLATVAGVAAVLGLTRVARQRLTPDRPASALSSGS